VIQQFQRLGAQPQLNCVVGRNATTMDELAIHYYRRRVENTETKNLIMVRNFANLHCNTLLFSHSFNDARGDLTLGTTGTQNKNLQHEPLLSKYRLLSRQILARHNQIVGMAAHVLESPLTVFW
jgi:hypothetical protein